MKTLTKSLLSAPTDQLNDSVKLLIEDWSSPPRAIEIMEVLDNVVRYGLGGSASINILEEILRKAIDNEETTYEEVVAKNTWRKDHNNGR